MTDIDINKSIRKVSELARQLEIDEHHCTLSSIHVSNELKKLCKSTPYYREIYDYISTYKQYNLMLKDASCFQFSEFTNQNQEQELRYAYYPNPYQFLEYRKHVLAVQELLQQGQLDETEYEQLLNECEFTHDIPVIRYDYSPSQYNKFFHPASHFHIGFHSENRWPVLKVLTPVVFFLKIISMYYPKEWIDKFSIVPNETLNDLYQRSKSESYAIPSTYLDAEDHKRLVIC